LYCNVGKSSNKDIPLKVKRLWRNMLNRCYNPLKDKYEYYGGAGVIVSNQWLDEYEFYLSIQTLNNYNKWLEDAEGIYSLDKDLLSKNEKVYSQETCRFITQDEQCQLHDDVYRIEVINKNTNEVKIYNSMNKAEQDLNIYRSVIGRIINNKQKNKTDYIFRKLSNKTNTINN